MALYGLFLHPGYRGPIVHESDALTIAAPVAISGKG
jgi:hypothetical protein